jgi:hypothetical protein
VAVLPPLAGITGDAYLHPTELTHGFHTAMLIAAVASALAGLLAMATIRNPIRRPAKEAKDQEALDGLHCALDAPPLRSGPERVPVPQRAADQRGTDRPGDGQRAEGLARNWRAAIGGGRRSAGVESHG